MTDKEFRRLSREELVEIIYELQRSEAALREENDRLKEKLADRSLKLENAGSLAEASLALNGVFEAAQSAADQYLAAIRDAQEEAREKAAQAQERMKKIEQIKSELVMLPEGSKRAHFRFPEPVSYTHLTLPTICSV